MKHRVWKEKVCLVSRIIHGSSEDNLCRRILVKQHVMGWEGIMKEVKVITKELGLPDVMEKEASREKVSKVVSGLDVGGPEALGNLKLLADFRCHRTRGPGGT